MANFDFAHELSSVHFGEHPNPLKVQIFFNSPTDIHAISVLFPIALFDCAEENCHDEAGHWNDQEKLAKFVLAKPGKRIREDRQTAKYPARSFALQSRKYL